MIELRRIDLSNAQEITALSVAEEQQSFVATNSYSLIEAFATRESGYGAYPFGIYADGVAVGFAMFGYDYMDGDPTVAHGNYVLVRFMIDRRYQGRGLGKAALAACINLLQTRPWGPASHVWLSYEAENTVARAMYHAAGFRENGEMCGGEIVAVREL